MQRDQRSDHQRADCERKLKLLGLDVDRPLDQQKDLAWLRAKRLEEEERRKILVKILVTVAFGTGVSGVLALVWKALQHGWGQIGQ